MIASVAEEVQSLLMMDNSRTKSAKLSVSPSASSVSDRGFMGAVSSVSGASYRSANGYKPGIE